MPAPIAAIFVSSTWLDLQPERAAVEKALHRFREAKFIGMEYFGSRDETTRAASLDEVDRAELYIGIFAGRYGSGITEAEYRRARERQLDCFIYFKADAVVAPQMREADPAHAERLAALKDDLHRHTVATFSTPDELAAQVTADVHRWLFDKYLKDRLQQETVGEIFSSKAGDLTVAGSAAYRLRVGSALGGVLDAAALPATQRRKTPLLPNVRRFRGLIDRTNEVQTALATLPTALPVEIHGGAGVGKTVLLRTIAYDPNLSGNPDGVVYLDRVGAQAPADLLQCLYDSFYESAPRLKPREGELRQLLREPHALILLDDVKQAGQELEALFNLLPNCLFCIASEERRLHGEVKSIALAGLAETDALALIERELGKPWTPTDRAAAATLYELFDGHPSRLIFATASAREQGQSLAEIIVSREAAEPPGKLLQRSIESHSAQERRALSVLAALGGFVSKDAFAACLPDSALETCLPPLLDAKLIQADGESYALSAGVADALPAAADLEATWRDSIPRLAGWAEEHRAEGEVIARDFSVFQRAAEGAAGQARWSEVLRLARAVEPALSASGRWAAWQSMLDLAARAANESGDTASHAWALHELGSRAMSMGDVPSANSFLSQALTLRIELGDHWGAALTRHNLDLLQPPIIPAEPAHRESPREKPGPRNTLRQRLVDLPLVAKIACLGFLALATTLIALALWRQPAAPLRLHFSPARLEFLSTAVDQPSATRIVVAANQGKRPLSIGAVSLSGPGSGDFNVLRNECERTLLPGSACQVHLRFKPSGADPSVARLIFNDSQGSETAAVELRGAIESAPARPAGPLLSARPATMNFGEREVGTRARAEVTVTNDGGAPMRLSQFTLSGSHHGDFALAENSCQGVDIAPQTDCKIAVAFVPSDAGEREAVLVLTTIEGAREKIVLRGGGVARDVGAITAEPTELGFGQVDLRRREQRQIHLSHSGAAPVAIGKIALLGNQASDFTIAADGCQGITLAEGKRCRLIVSFAPTEPGRRQAILLIVDNTSAREHRISLFGFGRTPLAARLEFNPELIDFGERAVSAPPLARGLSVRNSGATDVRMGRAGIVGADARHFYIASNDCGATLAREASCRMTVDYRAAAAGAHDAVLRIEFDGGQREIPLRGQAVAARIPRADIRPTRLDFGAQILRARGSSQEVIVQNRGSGEIVVADATVRGSNSFTIVNRCARPLGEGASCVIRIDFSPRATGQQRADLIVSHNAAGSPHRVSLSGSGVLPAAPDIDVDRTDLQFGNQTAGTTSAAQTVTVSNTGAAPLAVRAIRIEGNAATDFTMTGDCASKEIAPRGRCQVSLRFAPRVSTGRRSATLVIHHNAAGSPYRIAVNGTAIVGPLFPGGLKVDPDIRLEPGWCCVSGNVEKSTRTQCAAKKGSFSTDEQSARNRCLPVIR